MYFWTIFKGNPDLTKSLDVNFLSVILAGTTGLISFIAYLWVPKQKYFIVSLFIFLLLVATTGSLITSTGNSSSIYIALWLLVSMFAGIFSWYGIIPMAIASSVFMVFEHFGERLDFETIMITVLSSYLPLAISAVIWHQKKDFINQSNSNIKNAKNASELNELANKSEVVINAIGDGIMAIDSQGLVQLINPAAQSILGWDKQDSLKLSYKSVLQLVDQNGEPLNVSSDPIQQVLNNNQQVRTNTLSMTTKTGKKLMASLVVSPVGDMGSGIIVAFRDITSEKTEEREQAEFISTASHEMRTPVASIEGYLGLALNPQTAQIDNRARDYILKAHASAQHLGRLFQDLLDVSKADDGRVSNNPKVINVVKFIHEVSQGLQTKASEKGLRLIYKPMPDDNILDKNIAPDYSVNLDTDHIREVVDNLIENAIKYTNKGEISIDVTGDDDTVLISIKDSGIGIPAEDMSHLFQKFYRVDNKDTREIGGTGLGLYLSRRLVELMGGRIWAESVYGQGSTFFVQLPRISNQEATRLIEQEKIKAQSESLEIKPIEDNPPIQVQPQKPTPQNAVTPSQQTIPSQTPIVAQTPTVNPPTTPQQPKPNNVPRGQALTPAQIAEYVAKQRALVAEQQALTQNQAPNTSQPPTQMPIQPQRTSPQTTQNRPQNVNIPPRLKGSA